MCKTEYFEKDGVQFKRVITFDDQGLYRIEIYWIHQGDEGLSYTITRQD